MEFTPQADSGDLLAKLHIVPTEEKEFLVSGKIETNFSDAALGLGIPLDAIDKLVDLFGDRVEFSRDLHPGDSFSIIYRQPFLADGSSLNRANVIGALFSIRGKTQAVVRYIGNDGKTRFFDQSAQIVGNSFLVIRSSFLESPVIFPTVVFTQF